MGKRAILRFYGSLEDGFHVSLEVGEEGNLHFADQQGMLPPCPELIQSLKQWQECFAQLVNGTRVKGLKIAIQLGAVHQVEIAKRTKTLQHQLKTWLSSGSFQVINAQLQWAVTQHDLIRVVLCTQDRRLHLLPWHEWSFIEQYQAEVAFGLPAQPSLLEGHALKPERRVKILAILGDSTGINVEVDRTLLETLPNAKVQFLVEPDRPLLNQQLWDQHWDILFFAGHSQTENESGQIHINPHDCLTIEDLKFALKRAIANGLQLAIFNSCDGLGLAYELESLKLPQMVAMRQPVPDQVAQEFLKNFLAAFVQGQHFYVAVREAREKLQSLEHLYPCSSWLPVIFQSLNQPPLTWHNLRRQPVSRAKKLTPPNLVKPRVAKSTIAVLLLTSWLVSGVVVGMRWLGWLQPLELIAFDHLMRSRPAESADDRIVLVTVDDVDLKYQTQQGMALQGSLSDAALSQLLAKLQSYQPAAIGLDIFRDRPLNAASATLKTQLQSVFSVCIQADPAKNVTAIAPPPEVPPAQIGFANIPLDPDRVIRRHIIGQDPKPVCSTDKSLSFLLTLEYLKSFSIPASFKDRQLQLGSQPIAELMPHQGGYHHLDWGGYTTLLNYRQANPFIEQISLAQVLSGSLDRQLSDLVRNRIILIGTIAPSFRDYHNTPIGKQAGVVIHAHMVSQLLSAVLDQRPLIWSLPVWGDVLWIWGWAIGGGLIMVWASSRLKKVFAGVFFVGCLYVLCSLILRVGGWLPLVPPGLAGFSTVGLITLLPQRKPDS